MSNHSVLSDEKNWAVLIYFKPLNMLKGKSTICTSFA